MEVINGAKFDICMSSSFEGFKMHRHTERIALFDIDLAQKYTTFFASKPVFDSLNIWLAYQFCVYSKWWHRPCFYFGVNIFNILQFYSGKTPGPYEILKALANDGIEILANLANYINDIGQILEDQ